MPHAILSVTAPDGSSRQVKLEDKSLTVGRGAGNELCFPEDIGLSRQHLTIGFEGDKVVVRDLGSKNGTSINGNRLNGKHTMKPGDKVVASRVTIALTGAPPAITAQTVIFDSSMARKIGGSGTVSVRLKDVLGVSKVEEKQAQWTSPLQALVRAGRELLVRRPLNELFKVILDLAIEAVRAERGVLLTMEDDELVVQASSGGEFRISMMVKDRVVNERTSLLIQDVLDDEVLQQRHSIVVSGIQSLMAVPLQTDDRVIGLIYVDTRRVLEPFTQDQLNLLTVVANVAAMRIERERLALIEEAERFHAMELQQAADIQQRHLPADPPNLDGMDLAGRNIACRTIGGDYYDFFRFPDGRVACLVADVAGKGLPASLLMMKLQAHAQTLAESALSAKEFVARLNRSISATCPNNRFITLFLSVFDPSTGKLTYCNAGHNPPMLFRAAGGVELLSVGGPVIGLMAAMPYTEGSCELLPGDVVVMYTDGITEPENAMGEEFGEERLQRLVSTGTSSSSSTIISTVFQAVDDFTGGLPPSDDRTIVVARWLGK